MSEEENIDPAPKSNDTPEDVNENSLQEQGIEQSKTQSENMETHAHILNKAPGNGWKHYFFEFLMLFFAVFCGFLAENGREQLRDNRREKEYIYSIVQDLKSDTLQSEIILLYLRRKSEGID